MTKTKESLSYNVSMRLSGMAPRALALAALMLSKTCQSIKAKPNRLSVSASPEISIHIKPKTGRSQEFFSRLVIPGVAIPVYGWILCSHVFVVPEWLPFLIRPGDPQGQNRPNEPERFQIIPDSLNRGPWIQATLSFYTPKQPLTALPSLLFYAS